MELVLHRPQQIFLCVCFSLTKSISFWISGKVADYSSAVWAEVLKEVSSIAHCMHKIYLSFFTCQIDYPMHPLVAVLRSSRYFSTQTHTQ